jgi:hypothetical protein
MNVHRSDPLVVRSRCRISKAPTELTAGRDRIQQYCFAPGGCYTVPFDSRVSAGQIRRRRKKHRTPQVSSSGWKGGAGAASRDRRLGRLGPSRRNVAALQRVQNSPSRDTVKSSV